MLDYEFVVATSDADREAAHRLRYAVFVKEVGAFARTTDEREEDAFDAYSTHFLAKLGREVVGTVRMQKKTPELALREGTLFGLPGEAFYDYLPFAKDGVEVSEVSRSAVLPEHRGSKVLPNLWKIAYNHSRALGCTHFMSLGQVGYTDSVFDAGIVYGLLHRAGMTHPRYDLSRRHAPDEHETPLQPLFTDAERRDTTRLKPPPVMRLFHRFGLRACGHPVFVPSIGRVGMAMLACPETFSPATLEFFHAPDPAHRLG